LEQVLQHDNEVVGFVQTPGEIDITPKEDPATPSRLKAKLAAETISETDPLSESLSDKEIVNAEATDASAAE
jgi:hypothetical protein